MSFIILQKTIELFSRFNLLENGYNFLNTITYSIIGVMVYFLVLYPYVLLRKIKVSLRFVYSVFIFVILGAILRMFTMQETVFAGLITASKNPFSLGFYLYYPHLFLFLALLFLIVFELSLFLSKLINKDKEMVLLIFSLIVLFPFLLLLLINLLNWFLFFLILFFVSVIFFLIYYLFYFLKINLLKNKVSSLAFFSQVLDSFTTFFSVVFLKDVFSEAHVFSRLVVSISPFLFIFIKIVLCLLLLYLIDRYVKEVSLNNYFKLFIIIIGFSTGLRNLFLISLAFI